MTPDTIRSLMPSLVYDCFISYNRQDLDEVGRLCRELENREVRPWRDLDLTPGDQWQSELHKRISDLPVFVAVIGPSGVTEWQNREIQVCLALGDQHPIISVILPGVLEPLRLPPFLEIFHRVDFRSSSPDPLEKLVQAITGHRPEPRRFSIATIDPLEPATSSQHESAPKSPSYLTWRMQQNDWLRQCLTSPSKSRAELGQPLHVGDPEAKLVVRTSALAELDAWWQSWSEHRKRIVILGEEGDGKTWVVGAWLNTILRAPTAPAVVFVPSTGAVSPDPIELISQVVNRQLGEHDPEGWRRAITNCLDQEESKLPALLLVLDGINERNSAPFWRELLERLVGDSKKAANIAVIVTCRSAYWHRHFARLPHIEELSRICELPPYDDAELAAALLGTEVSPQSLPPDLLALIRKPRYLALALKRLERLRDAGELTKERLIYEDWRYRLELKRGLSLDDLQFQDFLCSLAKKFRQGHGSFREPELIAALPDGLDPAVSLTELLTGGIFIEVGGSRRLDHDRIQLGLGLLLVDELEQAEASGKVSLDEVIAQWLEPYAEMDFKASVCHQAVLHALARRPPVAQGIQVALLREWTNRQNPEDGFKGAFAAYLLLNPSAYTALAERVWCEERSNPWLERSLLLAWVKHWESPNVAAELYGSCKRWLGFVHPARNEADRDGEDNERRQELETRLGFKLEPGQFSFAGYHFTVIEEVDLLRLGRLALALMSHVPSAAWIPALTVGILAEAIMDFPIKFDLFAWVLRSVREDLWPAVKKRSEELISTGHTVALQAAYRLLICHGSEDAQSLAATLPEDLFPTDHWMEAHEKDPCTSLYSWERECCEECLLREDIKALVLARRLEP